MSITTMNANVTLFTSIMKNATDLHKDEKGNVIARFYDIPLELLEIDPRYQCDRNHPTTSRLAKNWDWRKYDFITVIPHAETSTFSVVDGQNRTNAAREKGLESLPCKIVMTLPDDPETRLIEEAKMFVK